MLFRLKVWQWKFKLGQEIYTVACISQKAHTIMFVPSEHRFKTTIKNLCWKFLMPIFYH